MTGRCRLAWLTLLAVAAAGCASVGSVADREFAAGHYGAAAAAYEEALRSDPSAQRDPNLRLHLALAYAMPGNANDPAKALDALRNVATLFPKSAAAGTAGLVVPLVEQEIRLTDDLAAAQGQVTALEAAVKDRDDQLQKLRASLADAQAQLHRVRQELEQLKRLDTRRGH